MKATLRKVIDINGKEVWGAFIDDEGVRAIRFCLGYNPDGRINLDTVRSAHIREWVEKNYLGIFGANALDFMPEWNDPRYHAYETMLDHIVWNIKARAQDRYW